MATFLEIVGDKPISLRWQQETYVVFHVVRRLARGKKVFVESAPSLNLERKKPMKKTSLSLSLQSPCLVAQPLVSLRMVSMPW